MHVHPTPTLIAACIESAIDDAFAAVWRDERPIMRNDIYGAIYAGLRRARETHDRERLAMEIAYHREALERLTAAAPAVTESLQVAA